MKALKLNFNILIVIQHCLNFSILLNTVKYNFFHVYILFLKSLVTKRKFAITLALPVFESASSLLFSLLVFLTGQQCLLTKTAAMQKQENQVMSWKNILFLCFCLQSIPSSKSEFLKKHTALRKARVCRQTSPVLKFTQDDYQWQLLSLCK